MTQSLGRTGDVSQSWRARLRDTACSLLRPASRRRGIEYLDGDDVDADTRLRALTDVARANVVFAGARVVVREIQRVVAATTNHTLTLLDIGTGTGDIPRLAIAAARAHGVALTAIGLDVSPTLAQCAHASGLLGVCGDALSLPFADRSVDVSVCSQLLHHFSDDDAVRLLRELDRVSRLGVVVCDLRRSWFSAAGFWVATFVLRFHPVSRHDGVVSVLRAFTRHELAGLVRAAVGHAHPVKHALGFRLAVSWAPARDAELGSESNFILFPRVRGKRMKFDSDPNFPHHGIWRPMANDAE